MRLYRNVENSIPVLGNLRSANDVELSSRRYVRSGSGCIDYRLRVGVINEICAYDILCRSKGN